MDDGTSISVAPEPAYFEVTFERAARIWWALAWRGLLYCGLSGFLIGAVEGFWGLARLAVPSGVLVGIPVGTYVVRCVLRKRYQNFSIRLVPSTR